MRCRLVRIVFAAMVSPNLPAAWLGSVAVRITDWVSAVGEVGGSYKSDTAQRFV